jgi:hypothetical protein
MKLTNQQFAQAIFEQRVARAPFSPFRPTDRVLDTAAAYDVQDELVALLRKARNADIVGYKIGLTSTAMQTMCGIDKPVFGRILSDQVFQSEHESISGNTSILAWNSKSRSSSAAISSPTAALVHGRYRGTHGSNLPRPRIGGRPACRLQRARCLFVDSRQRLECRRGARGLAAASLRIYRPARTRVLARPTRRNRHRGLPACARVRCMAGRRACIQRIAPACGRYRHDRECGANLLSGRR